MSLCHSSLNENRQQKSNSETDKSVQPNLILILAKQLKSTCTLVELFKRSEVLKVTPVIFNCTTNKLLIMSKKNPMLLRTESNIEKR